jgi:CRISPR-associated protein Cas2
LNSRRTYLVAYDIRAPHRLVRVHRALTRLGHALQYSVFAADLAPNEKADAIKALYAVVDPAIDDVRIYPVPADPFGAWRGPRLASPALVVATAPAATLAERLAGRAFWRVDGQPRGGGARGQRP